MKITKKATFSFIFMPMIKKLTLKLKSKHLHLKSIYSFMIIKIKLLHLSRSIPGTSLTSLYFILLTLLIIWMENILYNLNTINKNFNNNLFTTHLLSIIMMSGKLYQNTFISQKSMREKNHTMKSMYLNPALSTLKFSNALEKLIFR